MMANVPHVTSVSGLRKFQADGILFDRVHDVPYRNCIYNRLPEDEPSGSKHVEDIKKIKT